MYLVETVAKDDIRGNQFVEMFVTFSDEQIEMADRLEVWGTNFNEGTEDYCEYRLMNGDTVIVNRRVAGY